MKVTVQMDESDFSLFVAFRDTKRVEDLRRKEVIRLLNSLCSAVLETLSVNLKSKEVSYISVERVERLIRLASSSFRCDDS